jgi:hypothetical protein
MRLGVIRTVGQFPDRCPYQKLRSDCVLHVEILALRYQLLVLHRANRHRRLGLNEPGPFTKKPPRFERFSDFRASLRLVKCRYRSRNVDRYRVEGFDRGGADSHSLKVPWKLYSMSCLVK